MSFDVYDADGVIVGNMDYNQYLLSDAWVIKRQIWIKEVDGKCQRCGLNEIELQACDDHLTIHHDDYNCLGNEKLGCCIRVLCWNCHQIVHIQENIDLIEKLFPESKSKKRINTDGLAEEFFNENRRQS